MSNSRVNIYSYTAASNPYFVKSLAHKYGYEYQKDQTLASVLQQLVSYEGEPVLMEIIENSPDKDLFMEYFEKKYAKKEEKFLASRPSIKPVRSDKLAKGVNFLSGFGYRIHPIFKVKKMHYGIDFTAPKGTAIQATGSGRVVKATRNAGFGNHIVIDHGFGYQTIYAHLSKINIRQGDQVVRGQLIGTVGSSGISTAPHCHYEVHVNGKPVNPISYCLDGLSVQEYKELVTLAGQVVQSLD